jgi:uncharacterized membrane protein YhhN
MLILMACQALEEKWEYSAALHQLFIGKAMIQIRMRFYNYILL